MELQFHLKESVREVRDHVLHPKLHSRLLGSLLCVDAGEGVPGACGVGVAKFPLELRVVTRGSSIPPKDRIHHSAGDVSDDELLSFSLCSNM